MCVHVHVSIHAHTQVNYRGYTFCILLKNVMHKEHFALVSK